MTTTTQIDSASLVWNTGLRYSNDPKFGESHTARVDFGITDTKGRKLGCRIEINQRETYSKVVSTVTGNYEFERLDGFKITIQATRDGKSFGAHQFGSGHFVTLEEAKAEGIKRAAASMKRQLKNFPAL